MDESTPRSNENPRTVRYAAAVVAAIVAVTAWLWARSGESGTAPPGSTAPPAKSFAPRALRPPPPPPPLVEDAKARSTALPASLEPAQRAQRVEASPCADPCRGDATAALRSQLAVRGQQSRGCYERALRGAGTLSGRVTVELRIGSRGQVCTASLSSDSLGDPSVGACILQRFQATVFPAPSGGCVDVRVPIQFVPKG